MFRHYFFLFYLLLVLASCSHNDEKSAAKEADQAYTSFRTFTAEVEREIEENGASTEAEWETEASRLTQKYNRHKNRVDQYKELYNDEQREEIKDLEERFEVAMDRRQKQYDDLQRRYRLRQDMLGDEVTTEDLAGITPRNITATYQKFISTLIQHNEVYTARDWEMIEGWWNALNQRFQELQDELQPADLTMIQEKQLEYEQIKAQTAN